jgi:hypothetical protein
MQTLVLTQNRKYKLVNHLILSFNESTHCTGRYFQN